jgi:hypothetical protein
VFGFFFNASKKKSQFKRLTSLILSPESFMNSTAGIAVTLFLAFLLLSIFSIASLVALFTPLLSPLG